MKQKDITLLVGSTFIIVLAWIIFNIYHSANTSTIPDAVVIQVAPINPNFDIDTVEALKKRTKIDPALSIEKAADQSIVTPTPIPSNAPTIISPTPISNETSSNSALFNTFQ